MHTGDNCSTKPTLNHRFCVAPMISWTDRFERYFLRLISRYALLYTEMITTGALIYGDRKRYLRFDPSEHPVALQLGGSQPKEMALCARMAEDEGYDEVNINVGCPSERVQKGSFGACLMAEPKLIAECVAEMQAGVDIPITVKSRIGIDHQDSYAYLQHFVETVADAGCKTFIIHARKAWLKGLSPKQNRDIPPLIYSYVYRIKQDFPQLEIIVNGGIKTLEACHQHLEHVDGVMLGREIYHNPYFLASVDRTFYYDDTVPLSRHEIIMQYMPYLQQQLDEGMTLGRIAKHLLGLFHGQARARLYRRYLSEHMYEKGVGLEVLEDALAILSHNR